MGLFDDEEQAVCWDSAIDELLEPRDVFPFEFHKGLPILVLLVLPSMNLLIVITLL